MIGEKVCGGGHLMAAVPVCGSVRLVCLTCLSQAASGPARVVRGCTVVTFRLVELVTRLEQSESGGEFAALDISDVPGFDALFEACDKAGTPFTAAGLRTLARRIAGRQCVPVAAIMAKKPETVAALVTELRLRPEPIPA